MKRLNSEDSIGVQDWERLMWDWTLLDQLYQVWTLVSTTVYLEIKGRSL